MQHLSASTTVRTLDGPQLRGTLVTPDTAAEQAVVLVHGGGVTREEGGFFARLAGGLADAGIASLRYDLRAHGASDGTPQETTLSAHLNDIRTALEYVCEATGAERVSLLGTSFGGGLAAYYAAKRPSELDRLTLLNPQLNFKNRYVEQCLRPGRVGIAAGRCRCSGSARAVSADA
ncbi:alpha/beta hydrolase [Saccharothrix deserti]|uniref:alpha/beta hydrolase n=1 Tax=Saccharothrix deserti TaxID=2593674 RepID=UPI00131DC1D9|nr:alpha/beta fold hydrolase [Saccharothrix deserti]